MRERREKVIQRRQELEVLEAIEMRERLAKKLEALNTAPRHNWRKARLKEGDGAWLVDYIWQCHPRPRRLIRNSYAVDP